MEKFKGYNKPKRFKNQATVETVKAGIPYYVSSPTYGYEGVSVPIAGSVSKLIDINEDTGTFKSRAELLSLWATCTESRYQAGRKFVRCSLMDDGVIYQTYNDRLAFLDKDSAMYYANTGKIETVVDDKSSFPLCF